MGAGNRFFQCRNSLTVALVLSFGLSIFACSDQQYSGEPESYILPEDYVGAFYIIFNVPGGRPREELHDGRVYDIPRSGVLMIEMNLNSGWVETGKIKYFYRLKNGELREITERWTGSLADTPESRADTRVMIFGGGIGTFQKSSSSCYIEHMAFHVGTKKDILDMVNHFDISEIPDLEKIECK
jgi:Family of unknown function (DUF6843)